jgi:hypothetical protein
LSATTEREKAIADGQFGSGTPANWYLGLSVGTPANDGTGFVEPSGAAYARVLIPNTAVSWQPAVVGADGITVKMNAVKFTFPNPTGSWGSVTHWGLFLASVGGTPSWVQALDAPISPKNGNTPVEFAAGDLWMGFQ